MHSLILNVAMQLASLYATDPAHQTWAVIWKSSGIAAANRYSGRYSVADSGMGQVNSVAGIAGFGKNHNGPVRILMHQIAAHYT